MPLTFFWRMSVDVHEVMPERYEVSVFIVPGRIELDENSNWEEQVEALRIIAVERCIGEYHPTEEAAMLDALQRNAWRPRAVGRV